MPSHGRLRWQAIGVVATVIPLGLFARSQRAGADASTFAGFLATYTGDTLWPIMFYFAVRAMAPTIPALRLFGGVLGFTLTLEFGQLWQPDWLQWLRAQPLIGFILGNVFVWSDVVCLGCGSVLAVILDGMFSSTQPSDRS